MIQSVQFRKCEEVYWDVPGGRLDGLRVRARIGGRPAGCLTKISGNRARWEISDDLREAVGLDRYLDSHPSLGYLGTRLREVKLLLNAAYYDHTQGEALATADGSSLWDWAKIQ